MGHANLTNISSAFVKILFREKLVSIRRVVDYLESRGEAVHASGGSYTDRCMLALMCSEIVGFLLQDHNINVAKSAPVIKPVASLTPRQEKLFQQFVNGDTGSWDCGEDGEGGAFWEFDNIDFTFTQQWSKLPRNRIPILGTYEN